MTSSKDYIYTTICTMVTFENTTTLKTLVIILEFPNGKLNLK